MTTAVPPIEPPLHLLNGGAANATGELLARGDHAELAELLLTAIGPTAVHDEGDLHVYDDRTGLYRVVSHDEQLRIVHAFAGRIVGGEKEKPLKLKASDIEGTIKIAAGLTSHPGYFANAPTGIAFSDCFAVATADGIEQREHSPDNRARVGHPFAFADADRAPMMHLKFLDSLFRDDSDKTERGMLLQEFFGSSLVGIAATHWQKCLVIAGEGENGKSRLGQIISACFPPGSTCAISPHKFGDPYSRARLSGKLLNFVSELPAVDLEDTDSFKQIADGTTIEARHPYGRPFDLASRAGHYFAANALPATRDTTHAFWRRWIVLRLNRQFLEGDADRDETIHEKVIAAELPQIVVWMLHGACRMLKQRAYTLPASHHVELGKWRREADQVASFVDEKTKPAIASHPKHAPLDWTRSAKLYERYREWAEANGHTKPLTQTSFSKRLATLRIVKQETDEGTWWALQ